MKLPSLSSAEPVDWASPTPRPEGSALHLWYWSSDSDHLFNQACLDKAQCKRLEQLATAKLQQQFLGAHAGMRCVLASYLDCMPTEVELGAESQGKPYLVARGLQFNLSHTGGQVLLAVSAGEVGVDIERVRPVARLGQLAAKHFSASESKTIDDLEGEAQLREFFQVWACKEAVAKLTGLGLQASVKSLDTLAQTNNANRVDIPASWATSLGQCWLSRVDAGNEYGAAVAHSAMPEEVRVLRPTAS